MAHKAYMMGMFLVLLTAVPALAVNPAGYGSAGGEFNIKISRVPSNERAKAKATKSPFEATPEILAEGKEIFLGRGGCISCHGAEGKGDGAGAKNLPIQPRNFEWQHGTNRSGTRNRDAASRPTKRVHFRDRRLESSVIRAKPRRDEIAEYRS
jgi:mono/diheme cytochrome c family protein